MLDPSAISGAVSIAPAPNGTGYWITNAQGQVSSYGAVTSYGDMSGTKLNQPVVGIAATPDGKGYWLVAADGGIFTFGDAGFYGSTGGMHLFRKIVAMVATPDGKGYWLLAADGGIFTFGDAGFYGSTGGIALNSPIVGMAATPDGKGYWLVAADGGIFTFGDAGFYGSAGALKLNRPIVGMAATPDGKGYWLVAADGGIFTFGDAGFYGSAANAGASSPIMGISPTSGGTGYWVVTQTGQAFSFSSSNAPAPAPAPAPANVSLTPTAVVLPSPINCKTVATENNCMPSNLPSGTWNSFGLTSNNSVYPTLGSIWQTEPNDENIPALPPTWAPMFEIGTSSHSPTAVPVRWNPCQVIHPYIDMTDDPTAGPTTPAEQASATAMVQDALAQVAAATGLSFAPLQTTTAYSNSSLPYGSILFSWPSIAHLQAQIGSTYQLSPNYLGFGGPVAETTSSGITLYVSGIVELNNESWLNLSSSTQQSLLLHELGHAIGLDHSSSPQNVMYPYDNGVTSYSTGDLSGLANLGLARGCLPSAY